MFLKFSSKCQTSMVGSSFLSRSLKEIMWVRNFLSLNFDIPKVSAIGKIKRLLFMELY